MQKQPDKPRLWCIFNSDSGHWKLVNYEKQHEAVNASTAYTRGYEVHEMLCRSDVEAIIREAREAAVRKERERILKGIRYEEEGIGIPLANGEIPEHEGINELNLLERIRGIVEETETKGGVR